MPTSKRQSGSRQKNKKRESKTEKKSDNYIPMDTYLEAPPTVNERIMLQNNSAPVFDYRFAADISQQQNGYAAENTQFTAVNSQQKNTNTAVWNTQYAAEAFIINDQQQVYDNTSAWNSQLDADARTSRMNESANGMVEVIQGTNRANRL